jgi:UPF0716 family protein affecting phage T7 exclusion
LIDPGFVTDVIGITLLVSAFALQKLRRPDPTVAAMGTR